MENFKYANKARSESDQKQIPLRVSIDVEQFDVDVRGHATLVAQWKIVDPNNEKPMKQGRTKLIREISSLSITPDAIAKDLSELLGEFSKDLAESPLKSKHQE